MPACCSSAPFSSAPSFPPSLPPSLPPYPLGKARHDSLHKKRGRELPHVDRAPGGHQNSAQRQTRRPQPRGSIEGNKRHAIPCLLLPPCLNLLKWGGGHPNVMGLVEVLQDADNIYIVLPFCDGGEVCQWFERSRYMLREEVGLSSLPPSLCPYVPTRLCLSLCSGCFKSCCIMVPCLRWWWRGLSVGTPLKEAGKAGGERGLYLLGD